MPEALEGRVVMVSLLWWLREPQPPGVGELKPLGKKQCHKFSEAEYSYFKSLYAMANSGSKSDSPAISTSFFFLLQP